jgi:hypothetical protein
MCSSMHWHSQYAQTPGSAWHSGQIGCGGPGPCEDASDADCDDGGPSSDYSICPNGPDCHDCGPRQPLRYPTSTELPGGTAPANFPPWIRTACTVR